MSIDDPVDLVRRAELLMRQGRGEDAEVLLIEAWRLARAAAEPAVCGDVAFRIAATYRMSGSSDVARRFDREAYRFQRRAYGLG